MANLIPEIAKMLGVELGEEFNVKGIPAEWIFKLSDEGLVAYNKKGQRIEDSPQLLTHLLTGENGIVKLPWEPKEDDVYYTFNLSCRKWVVRPSWWEGFPDEYALLDKGWVYRTKEEAEAALPKVATEIGVEYEI